MCRLRPASRYYRKNKYSQPGPCYNGLTGFARTKICKILVVRICRPLSLDPDQSRLWLGEAPRARHRESRLISEYFSERSGKVEINLKNFGSLRKLRGYNQDVKLYYWSSFNAWAGQPKQYFRVWWKFTQNRYKASFIHLDWSILHIFYPYIRN